MSLLPQPSSLNVPLLLLIKRVEAAEVTEKRTELTRIAVIWNFEMDQATLVRVHDQGVSVSP